MSWFDQSPYGIKVEWGERGARADVSKAVPVPVLRGGRFVDAAGG